jgi:hypothetical protein
MTGLGILLLATALLAACAAGSVLEPAQVDASGHFPTREPLPAGAIVVDAAIPFAQYAGFAVVLTSPDRGQRLSDFFRVSIERLGLFGRVYSLAELEARIDADGYGDRVPVVGGVVDFRAAAAVYGRFLVLLLSTEVAVPSISASLTAIDPVTGETVFKAERRYANAYSADQQAFFPLFNAFADWARRNGG